MFLRKLLLKNFRNFEEAQIEFCSGSNLIHGLNAQGKTNLLEAIYLLSTGRSFRTIHLQELIQHGKPHFYIEAHFEKEGVPQDVSVFYDGMVKRVKHNQTTYSNFSQLLGLLPTVLYTPQDVALILGAPAIRRRFLDLHIAQVDQLYIHHLIRFYKALKQRNCLLRQKSENGIEPWEHALAHSASYITEKRKTAVLELKAPLKKWMEHLSMQKEVLELHYLPSPCSAEIYALERRRELHLGTTLFGPHRDDLEITIDTHNAKLFSSEGQKRCAISALRLAEWEHLKNLTGSPPLMSIDDFGMHLDESRQSLLQDQIQHLGQVFITSPLGGERLRAPVSIFVENGKIGHARGHEHGHEIRKEKKP